MSLKRIASEMGLRYFLVSYTDLFGVSRAKLIPSAAIDSVCEEGASFAGFATWLDLTPADPDIFAVPDPNSLMPLPWKPEVGWVAADLVMKGQPLAQAPRNVLKASLARAADRGFVLKTGVECEFFLLSPDGTGPGDTRDVNGKPCYDQQVLMRQYDLIAEICDAIGDLGWQPYQNDHEDANGQYEINWKYAEALVTADRHTFFKFLVKSLAEQRGMRATFMPKPFSKLTGNGCHMHVSLWDRSTGGNLFHEADGRRASGLSVLGEQFLGGMLHSAEALCAIVTPSVNSYRRIHAATTISGATWSPNTISYAGNNRTHMIRIPDRGRIELRLSDGAANPYLLPAAVLEAGLEGIEHRRDPGPPLEFNAYQDQFAAESLRRLPDNLLEALKAMERNEILRAGLGSDFTNAYVKLKHAEWRDYAGAVSAWEVERTLDC